MRQPAIIIAFLFTLISLNAQQKQGRQGESHHIEGRVMEKDAEGKDLPVPYANVYWANTQEGVISDSLGRFALHKPHVDEELMLVVSYVGYKADTFMIDHDQEELEVLLQRSQELEEVTVVKNQATQVQSKIDLMPTQVITEAGLQKLACCNIGESFESNATIDAGFSDAVSGAKKIQMLGLDGKYSQFLFENIPFMRGLEAGYGLSHIPGPYMQSIQISKGTSSVLNGYESTTGQINVEYKKPHDTDPLFVNLFANTEGRYESNVTSGWEINDRWSGMIFFHGSANTGELDHNDDGFYDKPVTRQLNFMNRWEYHNDELGHLQFGFEVLDENRIGGETSFKGRDESPDDIYGIDIGMRKFRAFSKLGYVYPGKPYQSLGWITSYTHFDQESQFGNRDYDGKLNSFYTNLIFQTIIGTTDHKISSGLSLQYDDYSELFLGENHDRQEIVPGVFTQYTWSIPEKMVFMTGLRYDYNSLYGSLVTPRLHLKYNINENYQLRSTLGKAYRSANIFTENLSLLASSRQFIIEDDPDIESAWNTGVSFSRHFYLPDQREASLTIDYYRTQFQNQVVVDRDHSVSEVNIYNLQGRSYSNSFQIDFTGELLKGLDMTLAYRLNDVRVDYMDGMRELPFVYRHKGLFTTTYSTRFDKWSADLTVQYNGSARIPDTRGFPEEFRRDERSPGFFIVHTQLTRRFKHFELYAGVENLTGFRQDDAIVDAQNPFGDNFDATLVWGPLTGRMAYGGLRVYLR